MVPCRAMLAIWATLLIGCHGLDSLPIYGGGHCAVARTETISAVRDGDTFEVAGGDEAVRLLGINSPEIAHNSTEVAECYGPEAAEWATAWLTGLEVRLEFDVTCADTYDRTLAYAYLPEAADDGSDVFVNAEVLREGYARVYEDFSDILLIEDLRDAQDEAIAANAGLWSECE